MKGVDFGRVQVARSAVGGECVLIPVVPGADAELTPVLRLGAGAVAGIIAMSATYPMDMIRGRLTVQVPRNRL